MSQLLQNLVMELMQLWQISFWSQLRPVVLLVMGQCLHDRNDIQMREDF